MLVTKQFWSPLADADYMDKNTEIQCFKLCFKEESKPCRFGTMFKKPIKKTLASYVGEHHMLVISTAYKGMMTDRVSTPGQHLAGVPVENVLLKQMEVCHDHLYSARHLVLI